MKIDINGCEWTIQEVDGQSATMDATILFFGRTFFFDKKIYLNAQLSQDQKRKTLAHELAHAFLGETQVYYSEKNNDPYTEEMLCEFMGHYGEQIVSIVNKYFE